MPSASDSKFSEGTAPASGAETLKSETASELHRRVEAMEKAALEAKKAARKHPKSANCPNYIGMRDGVPLG